MKTRLLTANYCLIVLLINIPYLYGDEESVLKETLTVPEYVSQLDPAPLDELHTVIFGVAQPNVDYIERLLMERSTPGHRNYQQWLSFDEVATLTSNSIAYNSVVEWLDSNGATIVNATAYGHYITAEAPISTWSTLLNAEFYEYKNDLDDTRHVRALSYSVPVNISDSIDAAFGVSTTISQIQAFGHFQPIEDTFPKKADGSINRPYKTTMTINDQYLRGKSVNDIDIHDIHSAFNTMGGGSSARIDIAYLHEYYQIGYTEGSTAFSQGVASMGDNYYSQEDVNTFLNNNGGTSQTVQNIGGYQTSSRSCMSTYSCSEGNLDLQYIMGIAHRTNTIYWHVDGSQMNPFVQWITEVSDSPNPPLVNSISFGSVEQYMSRTVMDRFNLEAMKLGLQGVTILVSSGDDGVANVGCKCDSSQPTSINNCACNANSGSIMSKWTDSFTPWIGTGYFPSFPATSPYVTAVGATMGVKNLVPNIGEGERACQSQFGGVITTGGGFSTYYPRPSWQNDAVTNYFSSLSTPPANGYNPNGRGYPDISLLGAAYTTVIQGQLYLSYGTSASAPVLGGMVTLLNTLRYQQNQTAIGFLNPSIYQGQKYFNDITSGSTNCCAGGTPCCNSGFKATIGWDPVTGFGSIYFNNLAAMVGTNTTAYIPPEKQSAGFSLFGQSTLVSIILVVCMGLISCMLICFAVSFVVPKRKSLQDIHMLDVYKAVDNASVKSMDNTSQKTMKEIQLSARKSERLPTAVQISSSTKVSSSTKQPTSAPIKLNVPPNHDPSQPSAYQEISNTTGTSSSKKQNTTMSLKELHTLNKKPSESAEVLGSSYKTEASSL